MANVTNTFSVRDNSVFPPGLRMTGLTPTWVFLKKLSDNSDLSQPSISEVAQGQYKFSFDAETNGEAAGQIDAGSSPTNPSDRYIDVLLTRDSYRTWIAAAGVAGKVSGAGTGAETFKDLDGTTTRFVNTVDGSGNRTAVALS